jgi:hypothetical protein
MRGTPQPESQILAYHQQKSRQQYHAWILHFERAGKHRQLSEFWVCILWLLWSWLFELRWILKINWRWCWYWRNGGMRGWHGELQVFVVEEGKSNRGVLSPRRNEKQIHLHLHSTRKHCRRNWSLCLNIMTYFYRYPRSSPAILK